MNDVTAPLGAQRTRKLKTLLGDGSHDEANMVKRSHSDR